MKLLIDSSVYISLMGKKDEYSSPSEKFMLTLEEDGGEVIMPSLVAAEIVNVLAKQKTDKLSAVTQNLLDFGIVSLDESILREMLKISLKSVLTLKTSDLVIAITARLTDATLVTWDKKLLKSATKICKVKSPKDMFIR